MDKFSVSMCVYGGDDSQWFRQAVESILNQTVRPDEIVLVVDGPVPEKLDQVIRSYEKLDCFQVVWLPENRGHGVARRTGMEHCTHELVALMDADDLCARDRFEKQLAVFGCDRDVSIVGGQITEFIGTPENAVGKRIVPLADEHIKAYLKTRCPMNQVTVMFKKSDVMKVGGYLDWYCDEDYYLWNRMYLAGMKFANVDGTLVYVRVGEDMYRRRGGWKYFVSEYKLQNFMLKHRVIGLGTYALNVIKRLILQVLMPNWLRGYVFQKFARTQAAEVK